MFKKFPLFFSLITFLSFSLTVPSFANESIEEGLEYLLFAEIPVVTSTGFFDTKATKSPGYSSVIHLTHIELSPTRTLADLIETFIPGMVYNMHESSSALIGVRGVTVDNSAKTLVMLNGQSLNHRQNFGWAYEYQLPLLGDLQRVEVINGPGAIVHGSGAISGFINLISKNGTDNPGFTGSLEYGFEEEGIKAEASYGMNYGQNQDLFVYFGYYDAEGFEENDTPWSIDSADVRDSRIDIPGIQKGLYTHGTPDPNYKLSAFWNHGDLNLQLLYIDANSEFNSVFGQGTEGLDAPNNDDVWGHSGILAIRPRYEIQIGDASSVEISVPYERMDYYQQTTEWISQTESQKSEQGHKESHYELKLTAKTQALPLQSLAFGGLYGKREFDDDTWFKGKMDSINQGAVGEWDEMSLFIEDVIALTNAWTVSLGARYDKVKYDEIHTETYLTADWALNVPYFVDSPDDADNTSYRVATAYEFSESSVIKASYQQGFRYPDANYYVWKSSWSEALRRGGYPVLSDLETETMDSYEINYHQRFEAIKLDFDVNLFYNIYEGTLHWHDYASDYWANKGTLLPLDAISYIMLTNPGHWWMGAMANAPGEFKSKGFELITTWQPLDQLTFKVSYGYTKPDGMDDLTRDSLQIVNDDKDEWIKYPNHQVKTNIFANLMDSRLQLAFFWLYNSGYDVDGSSGLLAKVYEDPRNLVNVAATYNINQKFSVKLSIKNLFEEDVPNMTYYGKPYSGSVGLDHRFVYLSGKVRL